MRRIVIVEDDPVIAKILRFTLEDEGYSTVVVNRGGLALPEVTGRETDLVILDAGLPDTDGFDLCAELRAHGFQGPVMFLTGRRDIQSKVEGFQVGADDYIVKPFEPLELLARVESVVRRFSRSTPQAGGTLVHVHDAELSLTNLTYMSRAVEPTLVTPTEMRLLEHLMRSSGVIISRESLIEHVWGFDFLEDTNRVDVYIRRLRRKIEEDPNAPQYLHTIRGIGYMFRPPDE